jgi:phenylacetate-CoA ligase
MVSEKIMTIYNNSPAIVQSIGLNVVETRDWFTNQSPSVYNYLNLLQQSQRWRRDEFSKYQDTRVRQVVRYAYQNIPFYRRHYQEHNIDVASIKGVEDLEKLPVVTKNDIISNWNDFSPNKRTRSRSFYTSGTTGTPLRIMVSHDCLSVNRACSLLRNRWAGHTGELVARFVGDRPVNNCSDKRLYRRSYVMNRLFFPSYCLSAHGLRRMVDDLKRNKIQYLQCYPSTAYIMAKFLQGMDEYFPVKAVLFSSEPMLTFQRELIEDRFQAKAFGFYGQSEMVLSASECEKGSYHLAMIDGVLEILRDGEVLSPGERGFTAATTLCNLSMPLIRYRLDDYTGFTGERCECGRSSPTIFPVEAKADDLVITPTGRIISPSSLTFPFKHVQHIRESQIIQRSIDQIVIRVVPSEGFSNHDESMLVNGFNEYLEGDMSVSVERVDEIHQTSSFKKRFVISELGGDLFERARQESRTT